MLIQILLASFIGSVLALLGGVILLYKEKWTRRISLFLVSFAAGSLLGAAFFDLIPGAFKELSVPGASWAVIAGILAFFALERFFRWYHCHDADCEKHVFSSSAIAGDTLHNFLDGVAIAASFLAGGVPVGMATTAAVFFHEIPQEIGDFGILLYSGYSRRKVFLYNLVSALASLAGAIAGYFFFSLVGVFTPYVLAFTAGSFIYIAASDIIPEVHHMAKPRDFSHVFVMILGALTVFGLGIILLE